MSPVARELLTLIQSGTPVRWLPKSVIYQKVIGEDTRECFIGRKMVKNVDWEALQELRKAGMIVAVEDDETGICTYEVTAEGSVA